MRKQLLAHRGVSRLLPLLIAVLTLGGCSLIEQLKQVTEPELPALARSLTVTVGTTTIPVEGGDVEVTARLLANGQPEPGVAVTFVTTAGEFVPDATATTDGSGVARRTLRTSEAATITAKVEAAGLTVVTSNEVTVAVGAVNGAVAFELEMSPRPATIGAETTFEVTATRENGAWAIGRLKVEFGDGRSANFNDFNGRVEFTHEYNEASIYNLALTLVDGAGNESRRLFEVKVVDDAETILELAPDALEIAAGETLGFTLRPVRDDGRAAAGRVVVDWGDGRSARLGVIDTSTRIEHTWRDAGSYRVLAELTQDDGKSTRASVRVVVFDPVEIRGSLSKTPAAPRAGDQVDFTFTASRSDGRHASGRLEVNLGDGSGKIASVAGSVAVFSHTYVNPGSYLVEANFDDGEGHTASASTTLTVAEKTAPPPPPPPPGGGSDAIDLRQATIASNSDGGIANFAVTSTVTGVSITSSGICIEHTKAGRWPVFSSVEGNPWIATHINGQLHAGTYEWLKPGQTCKGVTTSNLGQHVKSGPLASWRPRKGDIVYLFVSTHARTGLATIDERSNVVEVVWPY